MKQSISTIRARSGFPTLGVLVVLQLISFSAFSQSSTESLFGGGGTGIGLVGGTALQYGPVAGDEALFSTSKLGVVLGSNFSVGGFYQASIGEIYPDVETQAGVYHDMRMGGLFLEYTLNPDNLIHLTFPLQVGVGEVQAGFSDGGGGDIFGEDNLFVIEPGAMLEVNLLPWARLQGGVTYRIISGVDNYRGVHAEDLSGLTGTVGLRFGWFPRQRSGR